MLASHILGELFGHLILIKLVGVVPGVFGVCHQLMGNILYDFFNRIWNIIVSPEGLLQGLKQAVSITLNF